ncbi:coenzyme A transporter [Trichosporon asahii var. asahii CBS 2479]|uniref:Coenzyme A transporter n=1 Tax=Trichosporon asahii var. asahii (strain ATCC 90039 / CBS 2479 / JCM 2466 / KCTC 7840 / NBRC 103889/ NCYC 2677 / UAMH 7654) TaxID=1186058 RepID=J5TPS5_TRIAS|nr:coenzyme A transporter [Trichosporon asahii var. asahii CBS 2479]EJT52006.1 coenzyme A transporter [Trichosporon asahii var. asahii CBS 2479]
MASHSAGDKVSPARDMDTVHLQRPSDLRQAWLESRHRAKTDKSSWDYIITSGIVGGIAGCVAKTAIAPLDRVKILFQTSNSDFRKYAGTADMSENTTYNRHACWFDPCYGQDIPDDGVLGLFQGHSATLLRVFPYAGIKFMFYDWIEKRTPGRFFLAGATSGVAAVMLTYPMELVRVRMAYQTSGTERPTLRHAVRSIYEEARGNPGVSPFTRALPFYPFYRGFSVTLLGMIPYAGVSFLTYGTLKTHLPKYVPYLRARPTQRDLLCGAVAGLISQTCSYPFEVVRRRMQVGGARGGPGINWRQAVGSIYKASGWRGFFVGLSIGYIKVIPMTSISFATWQFLKRLLVLP